MSTQNNEIPKGLKEYLFALYWGQTVISDVDNSGTPQLYPVVSSNMYRFDESCLQLRPLSSIKRDELLIVGDLIRDYVPSFANKAALSKSIINYYIENRKNTQFQLNVEQYQYLQQNSFALPVYYQGVLYSVSDLESMGFIKIGE